MMYGELHTFLELAALDGAMVEVKLMDGEIVIGRSDWLDEGFDDMLGWSFDEIEGLSYGIVVSFDNIASVRRLDDPAKVIYTDNAKAS